MPDPVLIPEKALCKILGCSARTIYGMRKRGEAPPFLRLGAGPRAEIRYDMEDVRAWLEARKSGT